MSEPNPEFLSAEPRRRSKRTRLAVWGAVGALGVLSIAGLVVSQVTAATAAQTPSPSPTAGPEDKDRGWPGRHNRPRPFVRGMLNRGLHGEFTVKAPDGSYQVVVAQRGTVTAKTTDTVTVRSEDGYTATYSVNEDTRIIKDRDEANLSDLANNETVHVAGVKSGSTVTARFIHAGELRDKGFGRWKHGQRGDPSPSPRPTST